MRFLLITMSLAGAGCSTSATSVHIHVAARHPLGEALAVDVVANGIHTRLEP